MGLTRYCHPALWLGVSLLVRRAHEALPPDREGASQALAQLALGEGEASANDDRTRDGVADRDWDQVPADHLQRRQRRTREEARRQQEHVRHRVLKANRHEHRDREPDAHHLARQVIRLGAEEHRHAHKPVAHDGLHQGRPESGAALLQHRGDGELLRARHEQVRVVRHQCNGHAPNHVADVRRDPALQHLLHADPALEVRHGHGRRVACEELPPALEHK
mmetsp:Transcript_12756/g.32766  ORF Transcript_12756/g.32766 Transcript_12756/m.32766 type:complete len:220 (-) Transcript_12756:579-1238(-)